jgi:hypothetical protein
VGRVGAHELRQNVSRAEASLAETADEATLDAIDRASPLHPASAEAVDIANRSAEVVDWEDVQARETVLQLRLQSLRTQHNILIGNRNQLEERKAKYGPHAVPLEVENALVDIVAEIGSNEDEIRTVKSELLQLRKNGPAASN